MNRDRRSAASRYAVDFGAIVGMLCVMVVLSPVARASNHDDRTYTEEFHQTYPLSASGRVELDNINGDVHISSWDRNEVKVDAVKYAGTKERLDEAKIEVNSGADFVSIRTKYPDHDNTFNWGSHNNPAGVEYTLTVPRAARLDEIKLINGEFDVKGVGGEVRASCINGRIDAQDLAGRAHLSTINGRLVAHFDQLGSNSVELESINGAVDLTIPSDSKAELEASTVSGGIENDFGLHVNNHRFIGHDLRGELGSGGARIKLSDVNGRIEIHHAQDGHAMSPVRDLSHRDKDDDDDDTI